MIYLLSIRNNSLTPFILSYILMTLIPLKAFSFGITDNPNSLFHDLYIIGNEDMIFTYYPPQLLSEYEVFEFANRLNLNLMKNGWIVGYQLDALGIYADYSIVNDEYDGIFLDPIYLDIEKVFLRGRTKSFSLEVGDFYHILTIGVASNFRKYPSLDFDTSIRGAKVSLSSDIIGLELAGGVVNPQNVSLLYPNYIVRFPRDAILASSIHFDLSPVRFEIHNSTFSYEKDEGEKRSIDTVITGGELLFSIPSRNLEIRFDGDYIIYPECEYYNFPEDGYSLYLYSILTLRGHTLTLEAKSTENTEKINLRSGSFQYEYSVTPPLEYEKGVDENTSQTINSNNVEGISLRYDYLIPETLSTLFGAMVYLYDRDTLYHSNAFPEHIIHPYIGANLRFESGAYLTSVMGVRKDYRTGEELGSDTLYHLDSTLFLPLIHGTGIELYEFIQNFKSPPFSEYEFARWIKGGATITLTYLTTLGIALLWEYSNDPFDQNPLCGGMLGNFINDENYLAGEVTVRPISSLEFKLFAGARKGGISCSGGQCRILPAFKGVKLEGRFSF